MDRRVQAILDIWADFTAAWIEEKSHGATPEHAALAREAVSAVCALDRAGATAALKRIDTPWAAAIAKHTEDPVGEWAWGVCYFSTGEIAQRLRAAWNSTSEGDDGG